nr:MAG: hypothetical protein OI716_00830 [Candidatus Methanoperedens sp.]WAI00093.1 MAG: hypothetical protein OI720_00675 [Candidatus Methanoperedens sp.]
MDSFGGVLSDFFITGFWRDLSMTEAGSIFESISVENLKRVFSYNLVYQITGNLINIFSRNFIRKIPRNRDYLITHKFRIGFVGNLKRGFFNK